MEKTSTGSVLASTLPYMGDKLIEYKAYIDRAWGWPAGGSRLV